MKLHFNDLSDEYINSVMKKVIPNFICCAKNELKDIKPDNINGNYIIVNTLNRDEAGANGHWVCIVNKPNENIVEYHDSFGEPPNNIVMNWLKTTNKKIVRTTNEIQNINSQMCGSFCMCYCLRRYNDDEIYDILYDFSFDTKKNDDICKKYLKKLLNHDEIKKNYLSNSKMNLSKKQISILNQVMRGGDFQTAMNVMGAVSPLLPMAVTGAVKLYDIIRDKIQAWRKRRGKGMYGGAIGIGDLKRIVADTFHKYEPSYESVKQGIHDIREEGHQNILN